MKQDKTTEAIRALAAHPRWPALLALLERRRESLFGRIVNEAFSDSAVIRLQGQAKEVCFLLEQLQAMARSLEGEEREAEVDALV